MRGMQRKNFEGSRQVNMRITKNGNRTKEKKSRIF
jgi:hypothetical protein